MILYFFVFIASCALLFFSGKLLVESLSRIARFLEWREFVVAFFIMAFVGSLPNLFVGLSSAFHRIPQLSFGDIVGGNLIDLTIAVALAALIAKGLPAGSKLVQSSSIFTISIAILPLLLILDGKLGRGDGVILILAFFFYILWLFSKKERFTKVYKYKKTSGSDVSENQEPKKQTHIIREFKVFISDLGKAILGLMFLLMAAEGIVRAASFFAEDLNLPLALIGILIVGIGNSLPEIHFAVASARKGANWLILGDLMGAVIVPATLVLGIVALICPIEISDFSPFAIARFFLIISAIFFLFFVRTDCKISRKEALFLLGLYVVFVITEILTK
jgi:cation:H+ antiporter